MRVIKAFVSIISAALAVFLMACFIVGGFDVMQWHGSVRMIMTAGAISLSAVIFDVIK